MAVIVRISRGKEEVVEEGDRSKLNNRIKQLRISTQRGVCGRRTKKYKVQYVIRENQKAL